jgi:hypothetical protein
LILALEMPAGCGPAGRFDYVSTKTPLKTHVSHVPESPVSTGLLLVKTGLLKREYFKTGRLAIFRPAEREFMGYEAAPECRFSVEFSN